MQVGDPFMGKLLIEACLELFAEDVLEGIQDMGAAGLTSSSVEMAGRADNGVELDLDCVPRRAKAMTPYEILLSESQERMLLVAKPGKEARVLAVCAKWDLDAAVIGKVTDTGRWVVKATPGYDPLADAAVAARARRRRATSPSACSPTRRPSTTARARREEPRRARSIREASPLPTDLARDLLDARRLARTSARARWVWRQYDQIVRGGTVVRPGSDAAVVRVPCEKDGKTRREAPRLRRPTATAACASSIRSPAARWPWPRCAATSSCTGAEPIGLTDCLNFGNPERPEVMDQFARAIDGIAAACNALGVPIVSGNVSLYNETDGRSDPAHADAWPAVGLVASREDIVTPCFKRAGDVVLLLGEPSCTGERALGGQRVAGAHVRARSSG